MINRFFAFVTRHLDRQLMILIGILLAIGLIVLFSASGGSAERTASQAVNIGIALTIMWIAANVPLHYLARIALPLYLVGLLLLIAVKLFGVEVNGAQRWLNIGIASVQPSELMKIAVPMMLAWYFDRYEAVLRFSNFVTATVLVPPLPSVTDALAIVSAGSALSLSMMLPLAVAGVPST